MRSCNACSYSVSLFYCLYIAPTPTLPHTTYHHPHVAPHTTTYTTPAIFTADERRFTGLARLLQAGSVNWNRGTIVASARFPNTALGRSGFGASSNAALLYNCTFPQSRLGAGGQFDPSHRVPGMAWPAEMGQSDPSAAATPTYVPGKP